MQDSGSLEGEEAKAYALLRAIKGAQELNISSVFFKNDLIALVHNRPANHHGSS